MPCKWPKNSLLNVIDYKYANLHSFYSFPIAIKTSSGCESKQTELILEEAKNMIQLTKYHDHIVNLQGLTCTMDKENKCITSVSN